MAQLQMYGQVLKEEAEKLQAEATTSDTTSSPDSDSEFLAGIV